MANKLLKTKAHACMVKPARGTLNANDSVSVIIRGTGTDFLGADIKLLATPAQENVAMSSDQWQHVPKERIQHIFLDIEGLHDS